MTISIHDLAVAAPIARLEALKKVLEKAQAHCVARKIAPEALLGMRLFPDMFPLSRQIQLASDFAKGPAARLAGVENPKMTDDETTFEHLYARIEKTISFLRSLPAEKFAQSGAQTIEFTAGGAKRTMGGSDYLVSYATPNLYFHVVTAYDILRQGGVEIGKRDFIGVA